MSTKQNLIKTFIFTFSFICILLNPIFSMKESNLRSNQVQRISNFSRTQNLNNISFGIDKQENLTERRNAPINHTQRTGNVLTYHHHHDHNQVTAHITPKTHTKHAHFKLNPDDFLDNQRYRGGSLDRKNGNQLTQLQILANENRKYVDSRQQKDKALYADKRQMDGSRQSYYPLRFHDDSNINAQRNEYNLKNPAIIQQNRANHLKQDFSATSPLLGFSNHNSKYERIQQMATPLNNQNLMQMRGAYHKTNNNYETTFNSQFINSKQGFQKINTFDRLNMPKRETGSLHSL